MKEAGQTSRIFEMVHQTNDHRCGGFTHGSSGHSSYEPSLRYSDKPRKVPPHLHLPDMMSIPSLPQQSFVEQAGAYRSMSSISNHAFPTQTWPRAEYQPIFRAANQHMPPQPLSRFSSSSGLATQRSSQTAQAEPVMHHPLQGQTTPTWSARSSTPQRVATPSSVARQIPPYIPQQPISPRTNRTSSEQAPVAHQHPSPSIDAHPTQPRRLVQPVVPARLHTNKAKTSSALRRFPDETFVWIFEHGVPRWITYRIDKQGTRVSKTTPPPHGTYKVSEGLGRTDYSDPRDFFAPTKSEQRAVWNALKPTREAFCELTQITLDVGDMKMLEQGYNASWDEIKRKFVQWIYESFGPDARESERVVMSYQKEDLECPGYATTGTVSLEKQQFNPNNTQYLINGEIAVNVEELLCKLERWYGLIEDHEYSPTWPYERKKNSRGYLIQSPDCCACAHCRRNQILCYGFRERADRKCAPCAKLDLPCSNEDNISHSGQV